MVHSERETSQKPIRCRPFFDVAKTYGCMRFSIKFAGMKKGAKAPFFNDLQTSLELCGSTLGAGNESRTRDPDLGKVVLYQLCYSR